MMVDFALEAQRHGNLTPQEAIFRACLLRFRPIMMTTHGGAVWRAAAGVVGRRRLGAAATPGDHHCRRTGNEPAPYAVYHAGGVSLFSTVCGCVFRVNLNKR